MRSPKSGPLLGALVAIGFGAYSALLLSQDLAASPIIDTARAVEASRELPRLSDHSRDILEKALQATQGCSSLTARARLTTSFFLLQRASTDTDDPPSRARAFARTYADVLSSLRCTPLDGKLWAVAASLESVNRYDRDRFHRMMLMSTALAPYEQGALDARWAAIASAPDLSDLLQDRQLAMDLRTEANGGSPQPTIAVIDRLLTRGFCRELLLPLATMDRERAERLLASARASEHARVAELIEAITPRPQRRMPGWMAGRMTTGIASKPPPPPCGA